MFYQLAENTDDNRPMASHRRAVQLLPDGTPHNCSAWRDWSAPLYTYVVDARSGRRLERAGVFLRPPPSTPICAGDKVTARHGLYRDDACGSSTNLHLTATDWRRNETYRESREPIAGGVVGAGAGVFDGPEDPLVWIDAAGMHSLFHEWPHPSGPHAFSATAPTGAGPRRARPVGAAEAPCAHTAPRADGRPKWDSAAASRTSSSNGTIVGPVKYVHPASGRGAGPAAAVDVAVRRDPSTGTPKALVKNGSNGHPATATPARAAAGQFADGALGGVAGLGLGRRRCAARARRRWTPRGGRRQTRAGGRAGPWARRMPSIACGVPLHASQRSGTCRGAAADEALLRRRERAVRCEPTPLELRPAATVAAARSVTTSPQSMCSHPICSLAAPPGGHSSSVAPSQPSSLRRTARSSAARRRGASERRGRNMRIAAPCALISSAFGARRSCASSLAERRDTRQRAADDHAVVGDDNVGAPDSRRRRAREAVAEHRVRLRHRVRRVGAVQARRMCRLVDDVAVQREEGRPPVGQQRAARSRAPPGGQS